MWVIPAYIVLAILFLIFTYWTENSDSKPVYEKSYTWCWFASLVWPLTIVLWVLMLIVLGIHNLLMKISS